ncbi:subtilisin-like protein [Auriscalpium vulgare]|uniref:Subtilisin-like protein n=1 Tax=Auriscalpium vulgare TaxID=40419 RepID=A0ACB8RXV8_9AGAM|nr:subtilisin-like protein [Auriscalpium vulgare]
MFWLPLSVLAAVPLTLASPLAPRWDDFKVKHAWHDVPRNWKCEGPAPAGTTIDLRIALKPHRENALVDALYEVSSPQHAKYGAHLSKAEVAELVAPHPDTHALVNDWLSHHGVPSSSVSTSHNGGWLTVSSVPVSQADALLGASYQVYRHAETNDTLLRTVGYSLPAILHDHINTVAPSTYFGGPRAWRKTSHLTPNGKILPDGDAEIQAEIAALAKAKEASRLPGSLATVPSSCSSTITPSCLRALYNSSTYTPKATSQNVLGIAGYLEEYASHTDLKTFLTKFRSDATAAAFTVVTVNGGLDNQNSPGDEANLDIQYAESISFPTPNIYYSTGGSPPFVEDGNTPTNTNEPYLDWLQFILEQSTIPQTISTSYGDDEQTVPLDYAQSVCTLFAQLGTQGTSVLFSSGDSGVGDGSCLTNDGTNKKQFIPNFPASCPFVTAVGGTTRVNPEVAASLSSGGFSNYFPRPSYQDAQVTSFIKSIGTSFSGLYNTTGRGFPDISAQAENFQIVLSGRTESIDGTSCASPTAAAVISLLNDFRLSEGKPSLGFLNPLLYSTGTAGLNDITSGSNPGCGTTGFTAVAGWDPVTGLGTPDFGKLQAIVA